MKSVMRTSFSHRTKYLALFALLACPILPANASLLVRYTFDEASSGTTTALNTGGTLGSPADGIFNGSATRSSSTPGNHPLGSLAIAPDSNTSYVGPSTDVGLGNLGNAMTITTWINLHANNPIGGFQVLASDSDFSVSPTGKGWRLYYFGTPGALMPGLEVDPNEADTTIPVNAQDTWLFLAVSWNGTTTNFYTGTPTGSLSLLQSIALGGTMINPGTTMRVGGNWPAGADRTPQGLVDDFRIYDTALSQTQLQAVILDSLNIPEPGTLVLLGVGALALVRRR